MKSPTWAIIIGIFIVLFGSCGVSNNLQSINTPKMLEAQQEMMKNMSKGFNSPKLDSLDQNRPDSLADYSTNPEANEAFDEMSETMTNMFQMSEFTQRWTVRFGYIGVVVSLIYILGGVFLFVIKPFSIQLAYGALILSIIFGITQTIVLTMEPSSGFVALASGYSKIFGVVIDIVFLIVVATADKTAYAVQKE
jgi:hypothetical protein